MEPPATHDTSQSCICPRSWGTWCFTQHAGGCIGTYPCLQRASGQPAMPPGAQGSSSFSRAGGASNLVQEVRNPDLCIHIPLPPCYRASRRHAPSAGAYLQFPVPLSCVRLIRKRHGARKQSAARATLVLLGPILCVTLPGGEGKVDPDQ